jgi:hypothetical protein
MRAEIKQVMDSLEHTGQKPGVPAKGNTRKPKFFDDPDWKGVDWRKVEANIRFEKRIGRFLRWLLPAPIWEFLVDLFPEEPTPKVHRCILYHQLVGTNGLWNDPETMKMLKKLKKEAAEEWTAYWEWRNSL